MRRVTLPEIGTFEAWRDQARALLAASVPPEDLLWQRGEGDADLFAAPLPPLTGGDITVPRGFVDLARQVAALRRDQAGDAESVIHVSERLDRFDRRLTRVERRLEIAEDQPPAD